MQDVSVSKFNPELPQFSGHLSRRGRHSSSSAAKQNKTFHSPSVISLCWCDITANTSSYLNDRIRRTPPTPNTTYMNAGEHQWQAFPTFTVMWLKLCNGRSLVQVILGIVKRNNLFKAFYRPLKSLCNHFSSVLTRRVAVLSVVFYVDNYSPCTAFTFIRPVVVIVCRPHTPLKGSYFSAVLKNLFTTSSWISSVPELLCPTLAFCCPSQPCSVLTELSTVSVQLLLSSCQYWTEWTDFITGIFIDAMAIFSFYWNML